MLVALAAAAPWSVEAKETLPWVELQCTIRAGHPEIDRCGINDNCLFTVYRSDDCVDCPFEIATGPVAARHRFALHAPRPSEWPGRGSLRLQHGSFTGPEIDPLSSAFLDAAEQLCVEEVADLRAVFTALREGWRKERFPVNHGREDHCYELYLEPVDDEVLRTKQKLKSATQGCDYERFERHGAWLAVYCKRCWQKPAAIVGEGECCAKGGAPVWKPLLIGGALVLLSILIAIVIDRRRRRGRRA